MTRRIIQGDCREVVATLDPVDAVVTDPPYGLSFMGKGWDHGVPGVEFWTAISGAMKPGAHLLAFGGTRTYHRLTCAIEDAGFEIRDCIMFLYGSGFPKSLNVSKALDRAAGVEREQVPATGGLHKNSNLNDDGWNKIGSDSPMMDGNKPATPAAKQWQGWGTALKPSYEIIVQARKPLPTNEEQDKIVENLTRLEAQLWSLLPVNVAVESLKLSPQEYDAACDFARWSADEKRNTLDALSAAMDTSQSVSVMITCLNIVTSWKSTFAGNCDPSNTFITKTGSSTTIGWSTLKSCSSAITPLCIIQAEKNQRGSWLNALPAARILNVAATNIETTQSLSVLAGAIDAGHISRQDVGEKELSPNVTPIILARKPFSGTVASNVLEHGTGAINVDGCRVEHGDDVDLSLVQRQQAEGSGQSVGKGFVGVNIGKEIPMYKPGGRWPANVIHDGSDEATSGMGEAARYFYTPKASGTDRGNKPEYDMPLFGETVEEFRNTHPTVKPVDLMRYLCRLITPPGGTVLDPFCGSGSTIVAAGLEGFNGIGIELQPEYVEIAKRRIA